MYDFLDLDFSITFWKKKSLQMTKQQWAIGFSVLELSKLVMQRLFYNVIQQRFGFKNVDLLMTDTDSFLLNIKTGAGRSGSNRCTRIMRTLSDVMDFSNYPKDHELYRYLTI